MDRRYWTGLLIVVALGAIIFSFAQNQTLNQTQATLDAARITVTAQVDQLTAQATANTGALADAGTLAADTQSKAVADVQSAAATALAKAVSDAENAAATAQVEALAQAQAEATEAAESAAATAQSVLDDTKNTAATAQAEIQTIAENNAATAQAAQSAAQVAADVAATAQAGIEAQAAVDATALAQAQNAAATAQAQAVSDAQQPLYATLTAVSNALAAAQAQLTPGTVPTEASPTESADVATPAAGWTRILGKGVAIQLPESFEGVDLQSQNTNAIADALRALSPDFAAAAAMIEQNPDIFIFMAFDNRSKSGPITNVLMLAQDLPFAMPLKSIVDATIAQLPSSIQVVENTTVQVGTRDAARLVADNTLTQPASRQIEYFIIENNRVYIVVFTTTVAEYEDRLPVFEQAIQSLEILPAS